MTCRVLSSFVGSNPAVNHIDSYHVTYTKFCTLPSVTFARLSIISIWSTFSTFSLVVIDQESNFISEKKSYFTQKMKRLPYDVTKKKVFLR